MLTKIFVIALFPLVLGPAEASRSYELAERGVLQLSVPTIWVETFDRDTGHSTADISFSVPSGNWEFLISLIAHPRRALTPRSDEEMKQFLRESGPTFETAESQIELRSLNTASVSGHYFSVTDVNATPEEDDDFRFMTQGIVTVGGIDLTFTILTDEPDAQIVSEALNAVSTAIFTPSPEWSGSASATIADVELKADRIGPDCSFVDEIFTKSGQARILYKRDDLTTRILGVTPRAKAVRSIQCGNKGTTIYYYEFADDVDIIDTLAGVRLLIWGEERRSWEHPEVIERLENVIVVISGGKEKRVWQMFRPEP